MSNRSKIKPQVVEVALSAFFLIQRKARQIPIVWSSNLLGTGLDTYSARSKNDDVVREFACMNT